MTCGFIFQIKTSGGVLFISIKVCRTYFNGDEKNSTSFDLKNKTAGRVLQTRM